MTNLLDTVTGVVPTFTLGDRLRKARETAGLEVGQLAEVIGVHRQSISNYESGRTSPRRPVLRMWALVTGVDEAWLSTACTPRDSNSEPTGSGSKRKKRGNPGVSAAPLESESQINGSKVRPETAALRKAQSAKRSAATDSFAAAHRALFEARNPSAAERALHDTDCPLCATGVSEVVPA